MKLLAYCLIKQGAELGIVTMHHLTRPLHALQQWAWRRAVNENLRKVCK